MARSASPQTPTPCPGRTRTLGEDALDPLAQLLLGDGLEEDLHPPDGSQEGDEFIVPIGGDHQHRHVAQGLPAPQGTDQRVPAETGHEEIQDHRFGRIVGVGFGLEDMDSEKKYI